MNARRLLLAPVLVALLATPATAGAAKPAHALSVSAAAKSVAPGKLTTIGVKVKNTGGRTASRVKVSVRPGKGLSVSTRHPRIARTIRPGRSATARLKVRLRGSSKVSLRVAASASRTRTARRSVAVQPKGNGIAGRYFWRTQLIGSTAYYYGFYFSNEKWAYRGIPEGGLPNCTARTAPDAEKDGCVPYTFKNGVLTVDGKAGKIEKAHQIAVDGDSYAEAFVPAAGTRFTATGQYINAYGFPPYSTFVTDGIEFHSDGQFARSGTISGSTPTTDFGAISPDKKGTYTIQAGGRIHYVYADGHVKDETIGLLYDKTDKPNPNYGLLLDDGVYFGPDSDVN